MTAHQEDTFVFHSSINQGLFADRRRISLPCSLCSHRDDRERQGVVRQHGHGGPLLAHHHGDRKHLRLLPGNSYWRSIIHIYGYNRVPLADQLRAKMRGLAFFNWLNGLSFFPLSAIIPYEIRSLCKRGRYLTGQINSYVCKRVLVSAPSTSFRIT